MLATSCGSQIFPPCHFGNFQKFFISRQIQFVITVKRKMHKSVIFVSVICHRRSDANNRIIFFSVHLQTLTLKFSAALTSVGITFSPSSINKSILQLLRYGVFEFSEYVIAVKQYVFAYAYHTIQQAVLLNRSIIIFYNPKNFKKYFLRVSAISKMSVKRLRIFYCFEI